MIILYCLILFFTYQSYAITITEAIYSIQNNADEIIVQNYTKESNYANAMQSLNTYLPNTYLYYNYIDPSTPKFSSNLQNTDRFTSFATGLKQEGYGIAMEYNILAIPQVIKKIHSINIVRSNLHATAQYAKNKFLFSLAQTYITLYRTEAVLKLQTKIIDATEARYKEIKNLFAHGRVSKSDMLMAQSDYLTAKVSVKHYRNSLIIAKKRYKDKFSTLHKNMHIPNVSLYSVAPNIQTLKKQIQQNYAIKSTEYTAKAYKLESQINTLGLLPKVTIGYRHQFTNPDIQLQIPTYQQGTLSVNVQMDLLNFSSFFGSKKYQYGKLQKETEVKIMIRDHLTQAEELWNDTQHQQEMEKILQKVYRNTKETYDITKKEVKNGSKTFADELFARQEYASAELKLLEAKLQKVENIFQLKFLTNQI
ncbi:MAG: outer membrane protein TolC [Candidatus Deianiraeaceae bacterium]|jgi:outer membrane protein TolC